MSTDPVCKCRVLIEQTTELPETIGVYTIGGETFRPRISYCRLHTAMIDPLRLHHILVCLKRSIDPHQTDPMRYEVLRTDFDALWVDLVAVVEP